MNEKDLTTGTPECTGVLRSLSIAAVAALTLSACGGGDGVDIGSGQSADPVIIDVPIAYIARPLPLDDNDLLIEPDVTELRVALPGAELIVRDRAALSAPEVNVTETLTQGLADIRDLSASYDGERFVFAMRLDIQEGVDEEDLPTWNIWEYEVSSETLRRLIELDDDAEAGHDRFPRYLPDGRIVFSSTRQTQTGEILVDEGRGQFAALEEGRNDEAFLLHVMDADGENIRQISFNQSHDLFPSVMFTGEVMFTRWDQAVVNNEFNIYKVNPDGTELELLYGANSHDTGTDNEPVDFIVSRQLQSGRVVSLIMPPIGTQGGGQIVEIDTLNYVENTQPIAAYRGILTGPAQEPVAGTTVTTSPLGSPGGRYAFVEPLWDGSGRLMVSYSPCVMLVANEPFGCTQAGIDDPDIEVLPPAYGIWIYDGSDGTQQAVVPPKAGVWYPEVTAAQIRTAPLTIFDQTGPTSPYPGLAADGWGLLNIRSVYDIDGVDTAVPDIETLANPTLTASDLRPARFVRFVKAVSIPDDEIVDFDASAFGVSSARGMREILGYAPVEPDGSVRARVPANVPIAVQVLDANGRIIPNRDHFNWLQVMPGAETGCNGCHVRSSGESHGRADAFDPVYAGATSGTFPGTSGAWVSLIGETMAESRSRDSCANSGCDTIHTDVDIVYTDYWSAVPDTGFAYLYDDLQTPKPITPACDASWNASCRIVIHYEDHIHPLWSLLRPVMSTGGDSGDQCISCHTTTPANGGPALDAAAFLDLTDGPAEAPNQLQFRAYRELLANDNELEDNGAGVLIDRVDQIGIDPDTNLPIFQFYPVARSMVQGNSGNSSFFDVFDAGGSHEGWLTPAELKLLAEWLDIGAQYYNSPFDAPEN